MLLRRLRKAKEELDSDDDGQFWMAVLRLLYLSIHSREPHRKLLKLAVSSFTVSLERLPDADAGHDAAPCLALCKLSADLRPFSRAVIHDLEAVPEDIDGRPET